MELARSPFRSPLVYAALALGALCAAGATPPVHAAGRAAAKSTATLAGPVNINTASVEEFDALPGIGPAIAKRIVDYRREHGPFTKLEDLLSVKGVGAKLLGRIRDRLTLGAPKDAK